MPPRRSFDRRWARQLDGIITDLDKIDISWAACGNAGGVSPGRLALRLTDPHGGNQQLEKLPIRVGSLDENFIVVKRQANLALSHDICGFHLYGTDLCIIADILGRTSYVVDFHLLHQSPGVRNPSLAIIRSALIRKYVRSFRSRWITTTCTIIFLSGTPLAARLMSSHYVTRLVDRLGRLAPKLTGFLRRR